MFRLFRLVRRPSGAENHRPLAEIPRAVGSSPILLPVADDTTARVDSNFRMSQVFREERRYWVNIAARVGLGFAVSFVAFIFFFAIRALVPDSASDVPLRFDMSTEQTIAALALFATIVIALQVSVRSGATSENANQVLGRQLALELAANIAAAAVFVIPFAVAANFELEERGSNAPFLLAMFAVAAALAGLAADAAVASSITFGPKIYKERETAEHNRLRARLVERVNSAPVPLSGRGSVVQVALIGVGGAGVNATIYAAYLGFNHVAPIWWGLGIASLVVSGLMAGLYCAVQSQFVIGERLLGSYLLLLTVLLLVVLTFALVSLRPSLRPDALSVLISLLVPVLIAGVLIVQALLWTGLIPARRGIWIRGGGYQLVTQRLASRVDATHPNQRRQQELHPTGASIASIGILCLSFLLAPVGVLLALKFLQRPGINRVSRFIARASFWIGILISAALFATVMLTALLSGG